MNFSADSGLSGLLVQTIHQRQGWSCFGLISSAKFGDSSGLLWSNVGRSEKAGLYLTRAIGLGFCWSICCRIRGKSGLLFETLNGTLHLHNKVEKSVADSTLKKMRIDRRGRGWDVFRRFLDTQLRGKCQERTSETFG